MEMYPKLAERDLNYKLQYKDKKNFELVAQIDSEIINHTFSQVAFNLNEYLEPYYELTKEIAVPTLVITGSDDHAVGLDHYKNFKLPHMEIVEMDTKHVPFIEDKTEYFNTIKKFLN